MLFLFDVDGTLCESQRKVDGKFIEIFRRLREEGSHHIGLVSGSDSRKVLAQFGCKTIRELLEIASLQFVFFENGSMAYERDQSTPDGYKMINQRSIIEQVGEEGYQDVVNTVLRLFSEIRLPCKRGHMIELRTGTLNVSPIGRSCSIPEREEFYRLDQEKGYREKIASRLREMYGEKYGLEFTLGGQISIDIYPRGWDKAMVLGLIGLERVQGDYDHRIFVGDKCQPQGNDYPLYSHPLIDHKYQVSHFSETIDILGRYK